MDVEFSDVPDQGLAGRMTKTAYARQEAWIETFRSVGHKGVETCVVHLPLGEQADFIGKLEVFDEALVPSDDGYIAAISEIFGIEWTDDVEVIDRVAGTYL